MPLTRLYYFAYHSIRALLLSKGLEPKTHEGLLRLLGIHFIKPELLPTAASHIFARLMKYREEADYNAFYMVSKNDYYEFRKEALSFHQLIQDFLKKEGWLRG